MKQPDRLLGSSLLPSHSRRRAPVFGRLIPNHRFTPFLPTWTRSPCPGRRAPATEWLPVATAHITEVTSRAYRLPMPRPWGADVTCQYLIATTVGSSDGGTGQGFSWAVRAGAQAILAMVEADGRRAGAGRPARPSARPGADLRQRRQPAPDAAGAHRAGEPLGRGRAHPVQDQGRPAQPGRGPRAGGRGTAHHRARPAAHGGREP